MKFSKTSEIVVRPEEPSYFMIREFHYDHGSVNPIADFMKTPFFCWQEEYRNEVRASVNYQEQIVDWNFHGLYDIKKIRPEHFERITAIDFVERFKSFIRTEIGFDPQLSEIETRLNKLVDLKSEFYIIKELTDDFYHDWTVFDFFLSGFKITPDDSILTLVEFGLD
jgi:hypothetical protein